jgi:excisionase family DNA binding protein
VSAVVVVSPDELRALVREAVAEALAPRQNTGSELVTKGELARSLSCSTASIDRMVREGLPGVVVGKTRRFDREAVRVWLETRTPRTAPRDADDADTGPVRLISRGVR